MRKTTPTLIAGIVVAGLLWSGTSQAQTNDEKLEISAFAVNMSNIATGSNAVVQITVDAWSTAEERERLITTVLERGSDALLKELQKAPIKGRFRVPTARQPDPHHLSLGLDLRYAWQTPLPDGGRRIVLALDRYIGFREARSNPRSMDYPITLMEIRVDKDGRGQGKMAVATKISFDKQKNQVEIENYASEPVRLNNVEVKVKK
jgi:hypothetical protein